MQEVFIYLFTLFIVIRSSIGISLRVEGSSNTQAGLKNIMLGVRRSLFVNDTDKTTSLQ